MTRKAKEANKETKMEIAPIKQEKIPPRLWLLYKQEIVPKLKKQFNYTNIMQVPRMVKVIINVGIGEGKNDAKDIDSTVKQISIITGQKPIVRRAKKAIAGFHLRKGQPIGVTVTLRRQRMWEFIDRLVNASLPRIRDFKGLPASAFDGRGNYNLGISEQLFFPELTYDDVYKVRGMNITFVTTAKTDEEAMALLKSLGFPLRDGG